MTSRHTAIRILFGKVGFISLVIGSGLTFTATTDGGWAVLGVLFVDLATIWLMTLVHALGRERGWDDHAEFHNRMERGEL